MGHLELRLLLVCKGIEGRLRSVQGDDSLG